jgi:hypothetical protein
MASAKQVYKNPKPGQPLISTISSGCHTPVLEVKFCSLVNPFRYPNSPTIPRYSVTCLIDPQENKDFLKGIQAIEKDEKVDSILKNETVKEGKEHVNTGKIMIKFQTKDIIPIYLGEEENFMEDNPSQVELEDELAAGERVMIVYDILRYTKKNTMQTEHGISFKPTRIWYFPKQGAK